ncbi:hypothetical protein QMK38_04925 [Lysinibacillus fusiformis]|nr:hypothetical protein [Lysinibacillus fusiformis]
MTEQERIFCLSEEERNRLLVEIIPLLEQKSIEEIEMALHRLILKELHKS